jgi:hypothetical protein
MKIRVFGCGHHRAPVAVREEIGFAPADVEVALGELHEQGLADG